MKFRSLAILLFAALVSVSGFAAATDLIIPVTGTLPGANGSVWQGEITLHNASTNVAVITVTFFPSGGVAISEEIVVPARSTVTYENAISELFGVENGSGALRLEISEEARGQVAVTSRVMNVGPSGRFGQDIPAIPGTATLRSGSTAVVTGPAHSEGTRFNFGLFAIQDSEVTWRLLSADGILLTEKTETYEAGTQVQYNDGIANFLGAEASDGAAIHARILSGEALVYGSIVESSTGDPTFVPGFEVRENFAIEFLGVDLDENGTVDVTDADGDGVLDEPVTIFVGPFPNYFRVVVLPTQAGEAVLSLLEAPAGFALIDANGTIQASMSGSDRGKTAQIVVRATDGFATSDFVIPVVFK
ncbi:MAG: hypothetical protein ABR524_05005 [Thermoanaerobaculia bacterium]